MGNNSKKKNNNNKGKKVRNHDDVIMSMLNAANSGDNSLMQKYYSSGSAVDGDDELYDDDADENEMSQMMQQGMMCSAMAWVPRGAFALEPTRMSQIIKEHQQGRMEGQEQEQDDGDDDDDSNMKQQQQEVEQKEEEDDDDDEFNMKDYDDDGGANDGTVSYDEMMRVWTNAPGGNMRITNNRKKDDDDDNDSLPSSDSERRNYKLKKKDRMLVTLCNEEFITTLQVWVYEEWCDNIFLHHDVVMKNHGLCVEWLNHSPAISTDEIAAQDSSSSSSEGGFNLCAVGGFDPDIEIWDLDLFDAEYPVITLGVPTTAAGAGAPGGKKGKNKKKKGKRAVVSEGYHEGAVLGLSWNRVHNQFLASCGEDGSVRVWDLNRCDMPATASLLQNHNREKVHRVKWNHVGDGTGTMLLSGGFDGRCVLMDPRTPTNALAMDLRGQSVNVLGGLQPGDAVPRSCTVESLEWKDGSVFASATDSGHVLMWDVRSAQRGPLMCFRAHAEDCTNAVFADTMPGMLVTSGGGIKGDGVVRYWDTELNAGNVTLVYEQKSPGRGPIFALGVSDNLLAHTGLGGEVSTVRLNRCSGLNKHARWSQHIIGSETDGREDEFGGEVQQSSDGVDASNADDDDGDAMVL